MQRWILLGVIALALIAFFLFDLGEVLTLNNLKAQQDSLADFRASNPLLLAAGYFVIYVVVTALSLPGATIMTLAGGAIFGFTQGLLLVSFASSLGATLAFLVARFLLHDWVQQRFGDRIAPVNRGIEKDGAFYLFSLRLVPLFPFFMINLVMGLTPLKAWTFYWVSQVGMLAGTAVYVNAGTQLAQIDSLGGILSPTLIASFALLGLFPLVARKTLDWVRSRRQQVEV
ncbi:MAG: TVP38/TMEM64 family protein [Saccharospirillum sp.]|nr:TVP38/TMEM64 family protein [Saccharospirillum sp.]